MNKITFLYVVISVAYAVAAPVEQCNGTNIEGLQERVQVEPCGEQKCDFVIGTNVTVTIRFKTKYVVNKLLNDVRALVGPPDFIEYPLRGVYGTRACRKIVHAEDNTPAKCPLEANKEYIYRNTFSIETYYPTLTSFRFHWALEDTVGSVLCFEIPASFIKETGKL